LESGLVKQKSRDRAVVKKKYKEVEYMYTEIKTAV